MKKYIFAALVSLFAITSVVADNLTGIKVYINPGHGGYDANDRSCWTVNVPETWTNPDGYWESKSNLVKGLALRDLLEAAGAEVIMSRTTNNSGIRDMEYYPNATPEEKEKLQNGDDRDLSAIAEEANANNVDHFLSIHSNALNKQTNYLLMLYRGETGKPQTAPSDLMAASSGSIQIQNPLTVWTSPAPIVRGDLTFYGDGWGLGVLRPLIVPGFLSEGSFHDYAPETHRLCNADYCKLEAERMFQHIHKFFSRDLPQTAVISGWVKSNNEKIDVLNEPNFLYVQGSDDQWLPLNGATVKLLDAEGNVLQTTVTDNWYNGIFAFYDLQPGTYKVEASKDKYATLVTEVTVAAEQIAGVKMRLDNVRLDMADYPEPVQDEATMALTNYEFETFNPSFNSPATAVRTVYRQGNIFALTSEGKLLRYTAQGAKQAEIALPDGVQLADIAFTADNYLVAFSWQGTELSVYTWNTEYTAPSLLYKKDLGAVGTLSSFAVSGPRWSSEYYFLATDGDNSSFIGVAYNEDKPAELSVKTLTTDQTIAGAELMIMPSGQIYADSKTIVPMAFTFDWKAADNAVMPVEHFVAEGYTDNVLSAGANFFRYAKHSYMAMPVVHSDATRVSFCLFDITDGFSKAQIVSAEYTADNCGSAIDFYTAAMAYVDGYDMYIYLLVEGQSCQCFKSKSSPVANVYAGEVAVSEEQISFRLNEDANAVLITIEREGETIDSYNAGAMEKGWHQIDNPFKDVSFDALGITASARTVAYPVKISNDDPVFQFYAARGVAVDKSESSPYFGRIYVAESLGGGITEGAPANPRTTTTGIYVLSSDFTDITGQGNNAWTGNIEWGANNGAANYQCSVSKPAVAPDGDVFVTSSAFSSAGVYIMNPAEPSADFKPVFEGRRNKDTGALKNGTQTVTNPVMACIVLGTGADERLYTYDRDNSLGTAYSNINQYNIGQLETLPWTTAPSAVVFNDLENGSHMQNGSGQLAYDQRGGFFMSQYRYNSSVAVPALIHTTNGVLDYNIGTKVDPAHQGGMAVSADGSLLALGTKLGLVQIFDVTYDAANVPTLTEKYTIDWGNGKGNTIGMDFDAAGNLYIVSNSNERLMIYALPKAVNSYTTRVLFKNETAVENVQKPALSVYPNPALNEITVQGEGLQTYTVFDLAGHAVLAGSFEKSDKADVSGLAAGMYLLQVQTADGATRTTSLIKQ